MSDTKLAVDEIYDAPNPLAPAEHISHSALGMWKKCQQAGFFRYVAGLKIPPSMAMIQGTAFDKAESHNFAQKVKSQEDVKLSVVEDVLHEAFQEENRIREVIIENENIQPIEEEGEEAPDASVAENKALESLRVFHGEHAKKIIPVSSQRKFSIPLNGLPKTYNLEGIIDLEALPILDFETGLKGQFEEGLDGGVKELNSIIDLKLTGKSFAVTEAATSEQLTTYDAAVFAETGQHAAQVALLATVKTKVPKVQFLPSVRTDEDTERFLRGLGAVVRQVDLIKEGKMDPMGAAPGAWWCSKKWCGYWQFCKLRPKE